MTWYVYRSPMPPRMPRHDRSQTLCRVFAEGKGPGPYNVGIEFEDGHRMVTIRRDKSLRLPRKKERQAQLF